MLSPRQRELYNRTSAFKNQPIENNPKFLVGKKDAIKNGGKELNPGAANRHSKPYLEGYKAGIHEHKKQLTANLLMGGCSDDEVANIDLDELFDRKPDPTKIIGA